MKRKNEKYGLTKKLDNNKIENLNKQKLLT